MRPNAWHWVSDDLTLRDGRPLPAIGETIRHDGPVAMCASGLHASRTALQALQHAPGSIVCKVYCADIVDEDSDKLVCRERTILWTADATEMLVRFARLCALDVAHLWDCPEVTMRYLKTGDEALRDAAHAAAYAASDAANAAAYAASAAANAANAVAYAVDDAALFTAYAVDDAANAVAYGAAGAMFTAHAAARSRQSRRLSRLLSRLRGEE